MSSLRYPLSRKWCTNRESIHLSVHHIPLVDFIVFSPSYTERRSVPARLKPMSCDEITVDKDANDSRHVQHGRRSEWMVNEPLDGALKRSGRHHGSPPFSQGDDGLFRPDGKMWVEL
jgi:hypothetical protein